MFQHVYDDSQIIAAYKIFKMSMCKRLLFKGVVNIRPIIIEPDFTGLWIRACRAVVEENDVGFDTLGVENARGQTQNGVEVRVLQ